MMKNNITEGIEVWALGDFGPFSRTGKSIGYQIKAGQTTLLVDCGAPLFDMLGGHAIGNADAILITHCHDDHKRWFTDLALFFNYAPDVGRKVSLITTEDVYAELVKAAMPSLDRSLSLESDKVVDIAFEDFVDTTIIGPRAKYKIVSVMDSKFQSIYKVVDNNGNHLGPERAKVIISEKSGRTRMLFRDPDTEHWVEPESYYSYNSKVFYESEQNACQFKGLDIEAVKSPVWHGISNYGLRFKTKMDTFLLGSDTVHDTALWERMATEVHAQKLDTSEETFLSAEIIYGDINNYIERTWSQLRYTDAMSAYKGSLTFQDISKRKSVVHTDYESLHRTVLDPKHTVLTHSPDRMTSLWNLCFSGKTYRVVGTTCYEDVGGKLFLMDADVYHKEFGRFFAGYKNPDGKYTVYEKDGTVRLPLEVSYEGDLGSKLFNVDLYEDIGGEYFEVIEDPTKRYIKRDDGKVEIVEFLSGGSRGTVVSGIRSKLTRTKVRTS